MDLKPRLAILVTDEYDNWEEKLPMICFALNTVKCETTNHTVAFLQFGRELRTTDDVTHDLKALIDNDNFVAEITLYLKRFARLTAEIKEHVEQKQDKHKRIMIVEDDKLCINQVTKYGLHYILLASHKIRKVGNSCPNIKDLI